MRPAALAVLAIVLVVVPLAALRSEEAADVHLALSARIVRTGAPLALDLPLGEFRVLSGEDEVRLQKEVAGTEGEETAVALTWSPGAATRFTASDLSRIAYIQDYDLDAPATPDGPAPIRSAVAEGIIADLEPTWDPSDRSVTFAARVTVAVVVRPIATFTTTIGGVTVTIDLPEILVRRVREEVVVPLGSTAVYRSDRTVYLLLSAEEKGK